MLLCCVPAVYVTVPIRRENAVLAGKATGTHSPPLGVRKAEEMAALTLVSV